MNPWIKAAAVSSALVISAQVQATAITTGYEKTGETILVDDTSPQMGTVNGYTLDTIIAYAELAKSGDATEANWIDAVLDNMGLTIGDYSLDKIEDMDSFWSQVDGSVYNAEVDSAPAFYAVKIGKGGTDYEHFLYENLGSLTDLTIDLDWLHEYSGYNKKNFKITKISHVSSTGSMSVPEPAFLSLMGLGLLGFGLARRKRNQA